MVDGELEYEVEHIVGHRFVGHNKLQFLVKWLGYGVEHNTWEPEANCANCPAKVSEYWAAVQTHAEEAGVRLDKPSKAQRKRQRKLKRKAPDVGVTLRSKRSRR